jgi:hypothetical protein
MTEYPDPQTIEDETPEVEDTPLAPEVSDPKIASDTVDNLYSLFDSYSQWRDSNQKPIWEAVYRAYRGYKPQNASPHKFVYIIREIFRQMETLKPQLAAQFFSQEQLFKYLARNPGFEESADAATSIVHYQMKHFRLQNELMPWLDTALLYGVSYLSYGWRKFRQTTRKITPMHAPDEKMWWQREATERIYDGPYLEALKPWELFTHPFIEDCRNSPAVFIRKIVSPADLRTLIREGWIDEDATKEAVESSSGIGSNTDRVGNPPYNQALDYNLDKDDPQEMVICWTSDSWEYVIINRKLVRAHLSSFPEIPIISLRNYPQTGEHYGIPEPLIIMDDQRILNDFMSIFVDASHYSCVPMMKVHNQAAQAWKNATFKPGGAVYLDNLEQVQPLQVAPAHVDLMNVGGFIQSNMKLATGVTDELAGAGSSAKTATGLVRLQDAAGARMQHKVRLFQPAFHDVYRALYNLNAQYLEEETAVRIEGADGRQVFRRYTPDVFEPDVDVDVQLSNESNGPENTQKWMQLIQMIGQDPLVDRQVLLERMFRAMGEKRPKIFLANSINQQGDAIEENNLFRDVGTAPDPKPSENHMLHAQIHGMWFHTPEFQQLAATRVMFAEMAMKHAGIHNYIQAQQQAQAGQEQQGPNQTPTAPQGQGPGPVDMEASSNTEANFDNAARGAAQQGAMPG